MAKVLVCLALVSLVLPKSHVSLLLSKSVLCGLSPGCVLVREGDTKNKVLCVLSQNNLLITAIKYIIGLCEQL